MSSRVVRRARWVISHGLHGVGGGEAEGNKEEVSCPSKQSHSRTLRILSNSLTSPSSEISSSVNALDKVHRLILLALVVLVVVEGADIEVAPASSRDSRSNLSCRVSGGRCIGIGTVV
jgi:hypothetical protein